MKRIFYILVALICSACSSDLFPEEDFQNSVHLSLSSEIAPTAYVDKTDLPPAATKAMINASTVASMKANVLRIDENRNPVTDEGLYTYESWESAYLAEATVASPENQSWLRSMTLNPVQAYSYKVDDSMGSEAKDTTFYHTRMISWYPRTCTLYTDEDGKAPVMRLADFHAVDASVYDVKDGEVVLNFKNLDGTKDVMVSNIVEGQHWHSYSDGEVDSKGTNIYTYPFGQNESSPTYLNYMTYKHYLSAVKIYAYSDKSDQVTSMWGAIRKVIIRNQPSEVAVALPSPGEMRDASIDSHVQNNALDYGTATFSGVVDFPLIKTAMFEDDTNGAEDPEIAQDDPYLVQGKRIYLGYAMVMPNLIEGQKLEFDVHTDAGVLCLSVPMTVDQKECFQPGYIYTVDVNFNTEGAVADIVMESGDDHYYDLSAGKELANGVHDYHYANCYVVHPEIKRSLGEGEDNFDYYDGYAFLATMVGSATAKIYPEFATDRTSNLIEPVRAGLLWESSPGLVTQVELLYEYVRFKVQPPKIRNAYNQWVDNPDYKEGNAVIAVYDSQRKVLWSWHIWVTDMPKDVKYTVGAGRTFTLLDRNLGATSATTGEGTLHETYGLYYQWGRKDPSMGPPDAYYRPQSTATMPYYDYYGMEWTFAGVVTMDRPGIRAGVENPMYLILPTDFSMTTYQYDWMYTNVDNLWGDYREKTIYDPCPFDYMVPQDEISTLFASLSSTYMDDMGMAVDGVVDNTQAFRSFFPFAGYKGVDKGMSSLSSAWRYVGAKGDYMSAKIEQNGHRSRTYISDAYSWTEYGADADNDGDGDASRTYNSRINADDMANRRTAASVRCVKMNYGLESSLSASFVGDKKYAFVGDGNINFTYSVTAVGDNTFVEEAYIDLNGNSFTDGSGLISGTPAGFISGTKSYPVPASVGNGLARYRLVATSSDDVVSRVSYTLRLFDIADLKIDGVDINTDGYTCVQSEKHSVSFCLSGVESDFTVVVNGAIANKGVVSYADNGLATMAYTVPKDGNNPGINVPGHLHIQIIDADGNLACEKSYSVPMDKVEVEYTYSLNTGVYITNVNDLEAGGLYVIQSYYTYYDGSGSDYYCISADDEKLSWTKGSVNTLNTSDLDTKLIFYFHRNDSQAGGVTGYPNVCAGAWKNVATGKFFNENFDLVADESAAVYMTVANKSTYYAEFFLRNTGTYFCYISGVPGWNSWANLYQYPYRWKIYPVTATEK